MARRTAIALVLVLTAVVAGGYAGLRRWHPGLARRTAVERLRRGDHRRGLVLLASYARRFPAHARRLGPVEVGRPLRLRAEPVPYGLLLSAPALPPPASSAPDHEVKGNDRLPDGEVVSGPIWLDAERVVYAARRPEQSWEMVLLVVPEWSRQTLAVPSPEHYTATFEAAAGLACNERAKPAVGLRPNLGGATQPRLLAVSPDGSWLIFRAVSSASPPNELWRCRPDGTDALRLGACQRACGAVAFAPDGSKLAFFDGPRLCVVGLADTAPRVLRTHDAAAVLQPGAPAWSPDGQALAYGVSSGRTWQTVTCRLNTPQAAEERPRLYALEALALASPTFLVQSLREPDQPRWSISLRSADDAFTSRVLCQDGRYASLAPGGQCLAWRLPGRLQVAWFDGPLTGISAGRLPTGTLPERPTGPPAPASPAPPAAAPKRPSTPL